MCCSVEVHHIFSVLQIGICSHTYAVTDIQRRFFDGEAPQGLIFCFHL